MGVFLVLRAFYLVQDFVSLVDAGPNFLFASKACRVAEIANDAPIFEMQLGREIELDLHINGNSVLIGGSEEGRLWEGLATARAWRTQCTDRS